VDSAYKYIMIMKACGVRYPHIERRGNVWELTS
jgi:hypothetical protein